MIALLLFACSGSPQTQGEAEALALWGEVEAMKVEEGEPVRLAVRLREPVGWSAEPLPPTATGLEVTQLTTEGPLAVPGGQLTTWRYELSGPPGSYVIQPGSAQATGPGDQARELLADPIFVDLGVDGPSSAVADFEAVPDQPPTPWALYAALGAGALGLLLAWFLLSRALRKAPAPPAPILPAHQQARDRWQQVRGAGLEDHPQAVALSRILREYLEAITGWPATMRTGSEILAWMEQDRVAGASARLHAARILDATDRLKFAREGGGEPFFRALDQDFEAVIEATRPASLEPGDPQGGPR